MAHRDTHEDKEDGASELACTYAALILADDDIPVTADKLTAILKAANINFVEPFWPNMFARALENRDLRQMLFNSGVGGGAAGAPGADAAAASDGASAAAATEKKEAAKPVSESESDDDMGLDLFG